LGAYVSKVSVGLLALSSVSHSIFSPIGQLVLSHHPFSSQNLQLALIRSILVRFGKLLVHQPRGDSLYPSIHSHT
jgi:hypothetical protein